MSLWFGLAEFHFSAPHECGVFSNSACILDLAYLGARKSKVTLADHSL